MVYNRTKRALEKAAAIIGVVVSMVVLVYVCVTLAKDVAKGVQQLTTFSSIDQNLIYSIVGSVIDFIIYLTLAVLCITVIKTPVHEDGEVSNRKGVRIAIIIFAALAGNTVVFGLMIAVMCLKDFPTGNYVKPVEQADSNVKDLHINNEQGEELELSIEEQIAQLKKFKEMGVLDDETFKQALKKIILKALS